MYADYNAKTKKELKERIASGKAVYVYQPNDMVGWAPKAGVVVVEGPHSPQPHRFYAKVEIDNEGKILRVVK